MKIYKFLIVNDIIYIREGRAESLPEGEGAISLGKGRIASLSRDLAGKRGARSLPPFPGRVAHGHSNRTDDVPAGSSLSLSLVSPPRPSAEIAREASTNP